MTGLDVVGAQRVWTDAYSRLRTQHDLPAEPQTALDIERLQRRIRHLAETDPGGSWVAADGEEVIGLAQAFVRDDLWVLSLLGVAPDYQDARVGKALLDAALAYGCHTARGMILCSRDARAARRYSLSGFDLHPAVMAAGVVAADRVARRRSNVRDGTDADLAFIAQLDRRLRGGAHGVDLEHSLAAGCRLLVAPDAGYAVARGPNPVFLAADDEPTAVDLLTTVLGSAAPGETAQVLWMTAPQQWAIRASLDAGLRLEPMGPVMIRGVPSPPAPYLPSGAFG